MINLKKLFLFVSFFVFSINSVFGADGALTRSFKALRETLTDDALLSGISILFVYWGLYALFFWALRFFSKGDSMGGGHKRVRVSLSIILSFFVGSFFIMSLKDAGDKLGYVLGSWVVLFLLIPLLFLGTYKIYELWLKDRPEKSMIRVGMFILSLFLFLFLYSLFFAKVSYVILSDGNGSFNVFSSTPSGSISVEEMLSDVESKGKSEGGVSGGIIAWIASLLATIFAWVFVFALIAIFGLLGWLFTKHGPGKGENFFKEKDDQGIGQLRRMIRLMNDEIGLLDNYFKATADFLNRKKVK